jgi:uncharacterized membrane protein
MSKNFLNLFDMIENESIGKKAAKGVVKFFVGLLMFLILIAITFFVCGVAVFEFMSSDINTPFALIIGVILSLIYAAVVFVIPYLRKMGTMRWFAICALGDAIWWIYLLIAG